MKRLSVFGLFALLAGSVLVSIGTASKSDAGVRDDHAREMSQLLVKLELRTRGVVAKHYGSADAVHKKWMIENLLLPAAVADGIFNEVVRDATEGRAWVKMVVDKPRNPHNEGDATAKKLLREIRGGKASAQARAKEAYYYAEPITAAKGCLLCHGEPKGEPDANFPQYRKEGWKSGEIVGAVVSRVAY